MNKLAILSVAVIVLASLPIMENIPRHVNPNELAEEYPSIIDLLSIYVSIMDKVLIEDFRGSLENLNESMKIHIPKDVKYIYDRFNELLRDELDKLNSTKRYIDVSEHNILLGLLEHARGNLSMAAYTLTQANITYAELSQSVKEFERMLKIPTNQLAIKLASIEKLLTKYFNEIRDLLDKLEGLRKTGLEETEIWIWVDKKSVWVGESIQLNGFLRSRKGYSLEEKAVSIYLDGEKTDLLVTDNRGFFSTSLQTSGLYKRSIQVYVEYTPSGGDIGKYRASKSNIVAIDILYDKPLIHAELSHRKAHPGQTIHVYGWVNTSLGRLPDRIYMDVFGATLSRSLDSYGRFDIPFRTPENVIEGSYQVKLYTRASGIIAPSEKTLTIIVEKIPINVTFLAPSIVLSGGDIVVTGRVTASAGLTATPISYSKITLNGFGKQSIAYSVEGGGFTASINIPLSILTGYSKVSLFIEPSSQLYKTHSLSIEVFVINPLSILAPSILFAIALVYATPLVKEMRATIFAGKTSEVLEEVYVPETPRSRSFYMEAASIVGDATGLYIKGYETIREYLVTVRELLGEAYQIFEQISMLAERELYCGEPANRMIVMKLLEKLKGSLQR